MILNRILYLNQKQSINICYTYLRFEAFNSPQYGYATFLLSSAYTFAPQRTFTTSSSTTTLFRSSPMSRQGIEKVSERSYYFRHKGCEFET